MNAKRPPCTRNGGLIAAYVFSVEPLPDAASDFGTIAVMAVGLGSCARNSATHEFMDGLLEIASEEILKGLEKMQ